MSGQIPLDLRLAKDATFHNFVTGNNQQLIQHVKSICLGQGDNLPFLTFIAGDAGVGKSHLLMASCQTVLDTDNVAIYLSMKEIIDGPVDILAGLEHSYLVCIDDIEFIQDRRDWQQAFFDLINRVKEIGRCFLIVSASLGPKSLSLSLADLQSRLSWGISFTLQALTDDQLEQALTANALDRGIHLGKGVAHYLVTHTPRHMASLISILDQLDKKSLEDKRPITIPYIKQAIEQ